MYRYKLISLKVPRNKGRFIQNLWDRGRQILISVANDLIYANVSLNFSKGYKKFKTQNCPPPLLSVQTFSPPPFVTYPKKTYKLFSHTSKVINQAWNFSPQPLCNASKIVYPPLEARPNSSDPCFEYLASRKLQKLLQLN